MFPTATSYDTSTNWDVPLSAYTAAIAVASTVAAAAEIRPKVSAHVRDAAHHEEKPRHRAQGGVPTKGVRDPSEARRAVEPRERALGEVRPSRRAARRLAVAAAHADASLGDERLLVETAVAGGVVVVLVAVAVGVRGWGTIAVREARSSDAAGVGVACGSRETTDPGVGARGRVRTGGDAATGGKGSERTGGG